MAAKNRFESPASPRSPVRFSWCAACCCCPFPKRMVHPALEAVLVAVEPVPEVVVACATPVRAEAVVLSLRAPEANVHAVPEQLRRELLLRAETHLGAQRAIEPDAARNEAMDAITREKTLDAIIGDGEETGLFSPSAWPSSLDRDTRQR